LKQVTSLAFNSFLTNIHDSPYNCVHYDAGFQAYVSLDPTSIPLHSVDVLFLAKVCP
jgi:hypothetical protein